MNTEWRDLPTMADVAAAQAAGEEIETTTPVEGYPWISWNEENWNSFHIYRARPAQPKMKKIKIYGWLNPETGCTTTRLNDNTWTGWTRYPKLDDEIEVPE